MKESNLSKTFLPIWQEKNGPLSHLFRNNTGAWKDKFDRWTFYGVGLWRRKNKKSPYRPVGGGDHIGWTSKNICLIINGLQDNGLFTCYIKDQHMDCDNCFINKNLAVFTSIEFKTKNVSETIDQKDWKALVEKSGGIAEVVKEGEF